MSQKTSEVLQGTLDLMVLKTLYAMGLLHGFGIAGRASIPLPNTVQNKWITRRKTGSG